MADDPSIQNSQFVDCPNCNKNLGNESREPFFLHNCQHPICRTCLEQGLNDKKYVCKICGVDQEFENKKFEDFINFYNNENSLTSSSVDSESQSGSQYTGSSQESSKVLIEYCEKHSDKPIEYFCEQCNAVVCVVCIFHNHNGHKLTNMFEKCNVIKHNIRDFNKMLTNISNNNIENQHIAVSRLDEIGNLKEAQEVIVKKIFEELATAIFEKRTQFIEEFGNKFSSEEKRFKKLLSYLVKTNNELLKITEINDELIKFSESNNEAKILKRISDYTTFLQRSFLDIKRLYKTEISLKTELKLDPAVNPIYINTKNLLMVIDKIDPKVICYSDNTNNVYDFSHGPKTNQDKHKHYTNNPNNNNPNEDKFEERHRKQKEKIYNEKAYPFYKSQDNTMEESSINLNKYQMDHLGEDIKKFKGNLQMMENSMLEQTESISEYDNRRGKKSKLPNIPNSMGHNINSNINNIPTPNNKKKKYGQNPSNMNPNHMNMNPNNNPNNPNNLGFSRKDSMNSRDSEGSRNRKISVNHNDSARFSLPRLNSVDKMNANINEVNNKINNLDKNLNTPFKNKKFDKKHYVDTKKDFFPSIVTITETGYLFRYVFEENMWNMERLENISTFDGGVKYASLTCVRKDRLIICGGCYAATDEPTNQVYEINSQHVNNNIKLKPMTHKRWAHMSCYIHPFLYIIGGFNHIDSHKVSHITLKYCEKYNIETSKWEGIASLNQERAFSGLAVVNLDSIYCFGGFYNDNLIQSIEKFDTLVNVWQIYHVKLQDSLAKMGVVNYKNNIILLGGISDDFRVSNRVVVLDLQTAKWKKLPEMSAPRVFNNSAFIYNSGIYAVGGNDSCSCERLDLVSQKWNKFETYQSVFPPLSKKQESYNFAFSLNYID